MTAEALRTALAEFHQVEAGGKAQIDELMAALGLTEELLDQIQDAQREPLEQRLSRAELREVKPTASLDEAIPRALEAILRRVPPRWLDEQAEIGGGLDDAYRTEPLCIAASRRVERTTRLAPQRFAQMLIAARHHVECRAELDFWNGSMLIPELVALALALDFIPELGQPAVTKLASLHELPDRLVASTIYELLVGAACLRNGIAVEFVDEDRNVKTADMRLKRTPVPTRLEVKRKVGLSEYDLREAEVMREMLRRIAGVTDAPFRCDLDIVEPAERLDLNAIVDALGTILATDSRQHHEGSWGRFEVHRLPRVTTIRRTRLYSPEYLDAVFGWPEDQLAFDGLVARVDPPKHILVDSAWSPQCIAWRNKVEPVPAAKARGLRSLLADAVRQIPIGEMGFVYLAYEEGARFEIADARTKQVEEELSNFWHEGMRVLGGCLIHRLYPRPLREGRPDLLENMVYASSVGAEDVVREFPAHIFTPC